MISHAQPGSLTQGTLFSCGLAEDYEGCVVHGLVITARCDITNDKAEVFNYVPVVRFADWLQRDGTRVIAHRVAKSAMGDLKNQLRQLGLAASVLDTMELRTVLDRLFGDDSDKARTKARPNFAKNCDRHARALACLADSVSPQDSVALLGAEAAEASKLVKELCQNAVAEAYFLPSVEANEDGSGYVALLREIRHIPRVLASAIAVGLDADDYQALCVTNRRCADRIQIPAGDFSWPTGTLKSPFAEHLMQRLTLLFSRIGVTDVSTETILRLQSELNQFNEGR